MYSHSTIEGPHGLGFSREAALEVKLFGVVMSVEILGLARQVTFESLGFYLSG